MKTWKHGFEDENKILDIFKCKWIPSQEPGNRLS